MEIKEAIVTGTETLKPVTPDELQEMMKKGAVKFAYLKKDGKTERVAIGTKLPSLVTKLTHGGTCPAKKFGYSVYFDVEKEDFRVFHNDNLLGVYGMVDVPA